jgi:hypothetical protein
MNRYPLWRRLDGPHRRSGRVGNISPSPEFDPLIVLSVASRNTDWTVPVLKRVWSFQWNLFLCKLYCVPGYVSTVRTILYLEEGDSDFERNTGRSPPNCMVRCRNLPPRDPIFTAVIRLLSTQPLCENWSFTDFFFWMPSYGVWPYWIWSREL